MEMTSLYMKMARCAMLCLKSPIFLSTFSNKTLEGTVLTQYTIKFHTGTNPSHSSWTSCSGVAIARRMAPPTSELYPRCNAMSPSVEYRMAMYRVPQMARMSMHQSRLRTLKEKRRRTELEMAEMVLVMLWSRELTNHTDLRSGPTPKR